MASPSTYRLTIKFVPSGVPHFNERTQKWETSTWGHVWLEARKPSESLDAEPSFSRESHPFLGDGQQVIANLLLAIILVLMIGKITEMVMASESVPLLSILAKTSLTNC